MDDKDVKKIKAFVKKNPYPSYEFWVYYRLNIE